LAAFERMETGYESSLKVLVREQELQEWGHEVRARTASRLELRKESVPPGRQLVLPRPMAGLPPAELPPGMGQLQLC
jgi:hypothetical protein